MKCHISQIIIVRKQTITFCLLLHEIKRFSIWTRREFFVDTCNQSYTPLFKYHWPDQEIFVIISEIHGLLGKGPCKLLLNDLTKKHLFWFGSLVTLDVARCCLWLFELYINIKIGKNSC